MGEKILFWEALFVISSVPARNYLFKVSYSSTRIRCGNCWGLSMKTIALLQCLHCQLWTYFQHALIVDFEQANFCRVHSKKISTFEGCIMRYVVVYWNLLTNCIWTYIFIHNPTGESVQKFCEGIYFRLWFWLKSCGSYSKWPAVHLPFL